MNKWNAINSVFVGLVKARNIPRCFDGFGANPALNEWTFMELKLKTDVWPMVV